MSAKNPLKDSGTPNATDKPSGEYRKIDTEALRERQDRKAEQESPRQRRDTLISDAELKRQEIDEALEAMTDAIDLLGPQKVQKAQNQIRELDKEQNEIIQSLDGLFEGIPIEVEETGAEPLINVSADSAEKTVDEQMTPEIEGLSEYLEGSKITDAEEADLEESEDEKKSERKRAMAERIEQAMREEEEAEREQAWQELSAAGPNPTTIKKVALNIVENPADLSRLSEYDLSSDDLYKILKRASEDSIEVIDALGKQDAMKTNNGDMLELMSNRTDFESWRTTWNIMADTIRDAKSGDDIDGQLTELGDILAERPDRLELLFGAGEIRGSAKALDGISLLQRQTISERLRVYGFTNNEENIDIANALVLEHPDRFRDIYNTLPVSKKQTERLLSSIPKGDAREKVLIDMGLKIDRTKFDSDQIKELTAKYERGPDSDNRTIIETLKTASYALYEAAKKMPPELASQFSGGPGFQFADVAIRNSNTPGKRMVDVAGPILQAQNIFEQALAQAEADPNTAADVTELKTALEMQGAAVEQTRLAAEKELAAEFEATRRARQELYDAIKEESPELKDYIDEREQIENRLYEADIDEVQDLGDDSGITAPTRNYFDGMILPAVGKAASKELRAIQTPETYAYGYSLKAESMTTDMAVALGKTNVVPSVDRIAAEGATNFQEWYPSEALANIPWGDLARRNEQFVEKLEDVVLVRGLVRDIDGHAGNMKRTPNGDVVSIDHGQAFTSARPDTINQEPYNYFRCYASWAVGGKQMRPENKQRLQDLFKSKRKTKTRTALQKLFQIRFGSEAQHKWAEMEQRAESMMSEGLPESEASPHPIIKKHDEEAFDAAYVAGRQ